MINATHEFKRMLDRAETGIRHKLTAETLTDADREFYGDVWELLQRLACMIQFEGNSDYIELRTNNEIDKEIKENYKE